MEMASSSSAPGTSYFNFSLAQAVATLSINFFLVCLSAVIKSSSSSAASASASTRRRSAAAAAPAPDGSALEPARSGAPCKIEVDLDVVLGVMGAGGAAPSVRFEEAAALFEEDEATVEEAAAAFRVFDRNSDGFIDAGELGSVLRSLGFAAGVADADCQRMIDAHDEDKDGRINFQEFVSFMERSSS